MNWILVIEIVYILILVIVCFRIVFDTRSATKTLAYLLFAVFVPIAGMIFYFMFGTNFRNKKIYSKKLIENEETASQLRAQIHNYSKQIFIENETVFQGNKKLAVMLTRDIQSPLTAENSVSILKNGEEKFPEVLHAIQNAKHHVHIEYYIFEDDEIGREIEKLLIKKVQEGVVVRFIYDDFGSRSIRKKMVKRLKTAGVQIFPFLKISFIALANQINYRNHRKIIIVDGQTAFVGGINVSDKYINKKEDQLYWRDTHLRIDGPGVFYLQYLFLTDWNFCSKEKIQSDTLFFPDEIDSTDDNKIVQIVASGPDSKTSSVLYSIVQTINLAKREILITTPYFIPGETLMDALIIASLSGVNVKLLVPGISDSRFVNAAARSYYNELLNAGVEIYLYKKGFIHAKTIVADDSIAMIGTANMDLRSFDLNFEVNAIVYDEDTAKELKNIFYSDLNDAEKIDSDVWKARPKWIQLLERIAKLVSPML